ncbi:hypothetical protein [Streptomyces sp. TRM49041]|uniref:hypothetical protein n=1 Tax=Streptomyces sp. TRM49041 TaxID=2603216 RepID=UPI0011EC0B43|nr:hypothetical protein [Streptomyces sp. TRM49041]
MSRTRKALAATLGALTMTAAALATGGSASAAEQASPCWRKSGSHTYWCYNVAGAPVYSASDYRTIVGHMHSNPSWFTCKYEFGPNHGGPHPTRWLFTQADNGAWGHMNDNDIYSETNPVPTCP